LSGGGGLFWKYFNIEQPRPEKMIVLHQNIRGSGHPALEEKAGKFLVQS